MAKLPHPMNEVHCRELLRNFLEADLGVRVHFEKREMSAYFITEESPDLVTKAVQITPFEEVSPSGQVNSKPGLISPSSTDTRLLARLVDVPISELVRALSLFYGEVVDESNDSRHFNFEFVIEMPSPDGQSERERLDASDISRKLKKMGIAVKYRKGSVDFLVIDHVAPEDSFLAK